MCNGAGSSCTSNNKSVNSNGESSRLKKSISYGTLPSAMERTEFQRVGAGLQNMGNTCFLNSTLQCLVHTLPLFNFLQSKNHSEGCKADKFCMICELAKLVTSSFNNGSSVVCPRNILQKLKCFTSHMRWGRQEDAHEFLRYVIESIHKSSNYHFKKVSLANTIFQGCLKSQVTCFNCKHASIKLDPFLDICVDVKHTPSIEKGLQKFTSSETLQGDNAYLCSNCKKKVKASKRFLLHKLPVVFTIQLKRYSPFGGKVSSHVSFPERLDLAPYTGKDKQNGGSVWYSLYAVLIHEGRSTNSGHYYCYVKKSESNWFCMNDSHVSKISLQQVLKAQAYILFYLQEKRNGTNILCEDQEVETMSNKLRRQSLELTPSRGLKSPELTSSDPKSPELTSSRGLKSPEMSKHKSNSAQTKSVSDTEKVSEKAQSSIKVDDTPIFELTSFSQNVSSSSTNHFSSKNKSEVLPSKDIFPSAGMRSEVKLNGGASSSSAPNGFSARTSDVSDEDDASGDVYVMFTSRWKVDELKFDDSSSKCDEECKSTTAWKVEDILNEQDSCPDAIIIDVKVPTNPSVPAACKTFNWDSKGKTPVEKKDDKKLLEEMEKRKLAYGRPILTWSGEKSLLDSTAAEDDTTNKTQWKKRKHIELDEEIDRGRIKKIKTKKNLNKTSANPFQVIQNHRNSEVRSTCEDVNI